MGKDTLWARNELIAELIQRGFDPAGSMVTVDAMLEIENTPLDDLVEIYERAAYEWAICLDVEESKKYQLILLTLEAKIEKMSKIRN